MAEKLFINHTGQPLKVQLLVRQGDDPMMNADTVDFILGAGGANDDGGQPDNVKELSYGSESNMYLNGMVVSIEEDGSLSNQRFQVYQRGGPLDDKLNTNNTIMFVYHGAVQIEATNSVNLQHEAEAMENKDTA